MGTTCSKLNEYSNACQMYKCINGLTGLASNSASPTDTWIVKFTEGTKYDEKPIDTAFIKWFVSIPVKKYPPNIEEVIEGLEYEIKVYRDIIRPLIEFGVCPNFVRYLGSSTHCKADNMINFIEGNTKLKLPDGKKTIATKDEANMLLQRQVDYVTKQQKFRPSVNDPDAKVQVLAPDGKSYIFREYGHRRLNEDELDRLRFSLLVNRAVLEAQTLHEWNFENVNATNDAKFSTEKWRIIFQVFAACYAMSLSKMVHNDLHLGNVWVEPFEDRLSHLVTYFYKDEKVIHSVQFETSTQILVYDFDRSFVKRLGDNPMLITGDVNAGAANTCNGNQCNEYVPNKDFMKFMSYIYQGTNNPENRNDILTLIAGSNTTTQGYLKAIYENGRNGTFLLYPENPKTNIHTKLSIKDYLNFRTMFDMIPELQKLADSNQVIQSEVGEGYFYICDTADFNRDGSLRMETFPERFIKNN